MITAIALEGRQGDHRFFTTALTWGDLDHALVFHEDLGELDPDKQMQRSLNKPRIGLLRDYLLKAPDHFFSALTLMILPRDLSQPAQEFNPTNEDDEVLWDYAFEPEARPGVPQRVGTLKLTGQVRLFPADGQHRARSGLEALKANPKLAAEAIPVVLIAYTGHDDVRQLFSDLNLNAKIPSKTIGHEFETRNPTSVIAKDVAKSVPLFEGRTNRVTNSLPKTSPHVVTLGTLVEGTRSLLLGLARAGSSDGWEASAETQLQAYIASDRDAATKAVTEAWEIIVESFASYWEPVIAGETGSAAELREHYVFPHGLGWQGLAMAAGDLIQDNAETWAERFTKAVQSLDWKRSAAEWQPEVVIYDDEKESYRINNTGPGIRALSRVITQRAGLNSDGRPT